MRAPNALEPIILLDGTADDELTARLLSLLVEETEEGIYRCELTFPNWLPGHDQYLYDDRQKLEFGKGLKVQVAFSDKTHTIFDGRIMALEARFPAEEIPPVIAVLAEDRLQDLRMTRRTRTFADQSDADVIQAIAGDHSLTATVSLATTITHKALVQVNQSDLAFVRERARAMGAEVWVDGKKLYVKSRTDRDGGAVSISYGQDLSEFTVLADLAGQRSGVKVVGWDVTAKEAIASEATASAVSGELGGTTSGSAVLSKALAERKEQIVHANPASENEAKAVAEAAFRRLARKFLTGAGTVREGDPRIKVGTQLTLNGLGDLFSGDYYVVEVTHLYSQESGFSTRFRVERPGIGG